MTHNKTLHFDPIQKRLTVHHTDAFPEEIFDYADETEILDISEGHLTTLPEKIAQFKKMKIAFFGSQDFEEVPQALAGCESLEMVGFKSCKISHLPDHALPRGLRGLILTDNRLTHLPTSIGKFSKLQKLMLAGNQLEDLPKELLECQNLELLRLPVNNFASSPDWLFDLPKLGWYSDAGNPFHGTDRVHVQGLREISWSDISLGEKLGESAKNVVYRATLGDEDVAVKIYGSELTTDGFPIDEMNVCLLAGDHDHIIGGKGKLVGAPGEGQGLVMPLISEEFKPLGSPPDFKTLTRDVYPGVETLDISFVRQVLTDIALALSHCHAKGVMHGDIYAHNILVNSSGQSYLGDFGAASLYNPHSPEGKLRELVDVVGFGYLMEELLSLTEKDPKLESLKQACLNTESSQRPTFEEIFRKL